MILGSLGLGLGLILAPVLGLIAGLGIVL